MRIGTWNVEYAYEKRLDALHAKLAEHPADIWVLTETHDALVPPGCTFAAHSAPRPKNWSGIRPGSRWVSIWSRYPILRQVDLPEADKERTVAALLDLGRDASMLVYGTVLPWKGDREKFDWSEHHRVIAEQCAEWLKLRDLHADAALCIAGDYNTDLGTGAYYGTKAGIAALKSGLESCDLYCATAPDVFPKGWLPYPPIDHIALPAAWKNKTSIVAAWPADKPNLSDHSGMVVAIGEAAPTRAAMKTKEEIVARAADAAFGKPLVTNVQRSMLAEVIVAEALEPDWTWCAADYASCDFRHHGGVRLEVKQSAALQTWNADSKRISRASFDIAPRTGEYVDGAAWVEGVGRNADIYVFAYHPVADSTADHREPTQWQFYVVLEKALPAQKTLALSGVAALVDPVSYSGLSKRVAQALTSLNAEQS